MYTVKALYNSIVLNLFLNKPMFLRGYSTSLLKTLWKKEKWLVKSTLFPTVFSTFCNKFFNTFYTPANKVRGGILESACWSVGKSSSQSVHKILSGQLLLQFLSNSLDIWQKCSLGAVNVQDIHFVKNSIKNY